MLVLALACIPRPLKWHTPKHSTKRHDVKKNPSTRRNTKTKKTHVSDTHHKSARRPHTTRTRTRTRTRTLHGRMKKTQLDETERKKFRPLCSKEHAKTVWLARYYCKEDEEKLEKISMLDSYDDANFLFHIRTKENKEGNHEKKKAKKFILKFHNGVDSMEPNARLLDCHEFAMRWLSRFNICTSSVVHTNSGASRFDWTDSHSSTNNDHNNNNNNNNINDSIEKKNQKTHAVKVLRYVEGTLLIDVVNSLVEKPEEQKAFWRRVGEFVGIISETFLRWNPENPSIEEEAKTLYCTLATRESLWDVRNFEDVRMFLDALKSKGEGLIKDKNAIEQVFKWYEEHVNSIRNDTAKLRLSVIHNDLNESNVLVTASDWEERVNNDSIDVLNDFACIDFGDICISWTVIEIATAMAYCALATPNAPLESCEKMLEGVAMTFTLNEHEIKVLPVLLMSRVATSLVMGLYSHHFKADDTVSDNNEEKDKEEEFQDNTAYLLKSQQTGWNILKAFVQETPEKLATAYAGIFGYI